MDDAIEKELASSDFKEELTAQARALLINRLVSSSPSDVVEDCDLAIRTLIVDYLKTSNLNLSASVFLPEAGLSDRVLSTSDAIKALGLEASADDSPCDTEHASVLRRLLLESARSPSLPPSPASSTSSTCPPPAPPQFESALASGTSVSAAFAANIERLQESAREKEANDKYRNILRAQFEQRLAEVEHDKQDLAKQYAVKEAKLEADAFNQRQEVLREKKQLAAERDELERERRELQKNQNQIKLVRDCAKSYENATAVTESQGVLMKKELESLSQQRSLWSERHSNALEVEKELSALRSEVITIRSNNEALSVALETARSRIDEFTDARDVQMSALQAQLENLQKQNEELQLTADAERKDKEDTAAELEELRVLLTRSKNALSSLNPSASVKSSSILASERRERLERARSSVSQTLCLTPPATRNVLAKESRSFSPIPIASRTVFKSKLFASTAPVASAIASGDTAATLQKMETPIKTPLRDPSVGRGRDPPTNSGALSRAAGACADPPTSSNTSKDVLEPPSAISVKGGKCSIASPLTDVLPTGPVKEEDPRKMGQGVPFSTDDSSTEEMVPSDDKQSVDSPLSRAGKDGVGSNIPESPSQCYTSVFGEEEGISSSNNSGSDSDELYNSDFADEATALAD